MESDAVILLRNLSSIYFPVRVGQCSLLQKQEQLVIEPEDGDPRPYIPQHEFQAQSIATIADPR